MTTHNTRLLDLYTDGYQAYAAFFCASRHRVCHKFEGGTSVVEGVNTSLRHRCGYLVRRHCGPRDCIASIERRLSFGCVPTTRRVKSAGTTRNVKQRSQRHNQGIEVRKSALEALRAIQDRRSVPFLIDALSDPDVGIRYETVRILSGIKA